MIRSLRKKHLQIWGLWAVSMPIGIISAWLAIPQEAKDKLLQPTATEALPVIVKSINKDSYVINLRSNREESLWQLEWINKKTLTYPTATIYKIAVNDNNIQQGKLIGRIESRGTYHFAVDSTFKLTNGSTYQLMLYDFIHQKVIGIINF